MVKNVNEGDVQTLSDGGFITVWKNVGGVFGWYAIPVADVDEVKATADAALPRAEVTDIVSESPDAYMRVADAQALFDAMSQTIAAQAIQLANLESMIGADLISVLEEGIVEPGVVA